MRYLLLALACLAIPLLPISTSLASGCRAEDTARGQSVVTITRTGQRSQLQRNGKPYVVRGACAWDHLAELRAAGGNSVRTWGSKDDPKLYDEADALGLSVCAGLWFDWVPDDPEYMRRQFEDLCSHVRQYKDHPAILMWGIGNEYEVGVADPAVWEAIEGLARAIKKIDPNHPVITVVADVTREKVGALKQYCPSLDALGVNSYGGLLSLPARLREYGWDKAYLVTEFGELGPQDLGKTAWGAPIQMDSTYVAEHWIAPGLKLIAEETDGGQCLGSYLYLWGVHRQFVVSATWYHLFLLSGERLGGGDAAVAAWSGTAPANRAPEIISFRCSAGLKAVLPGSRQSAEIRCREPDGDPVEIRWEILSERLPNEGSWPTSYPACVISAQGGALTFTAPEEPGAYRLYAYVLDGRGGAATANAPFFVSEKGSAGGDHDG